MGDLKSGSPEGTLQSFLDQNPSVEYVRLIFVDYSAVPRVRVLTRHFALCLAREERPVTVGSPIQTACLVTGLILLEEIITGEDELWADWESLRVCGYAPGHASVMCFVKTRAYGPTAVAKNICPRTNLKTFLTSAKGHLDLSFLCGFEIEFLIMHPAKDGNPPKAVQTEASPYSTASLRNPYFKVVEEIVACLIKSGIKVWQFHSEGSEGMFEITSEPLPPLEAADSLIFCQETIRSICSAHNLHATLHPKPFGPESGPTLGNHTHISLSDPSRADPFLAGILASYPALAAFFLPNYDSYLRVTPGEWVSWGVGDKSKPIRKVKDGHWEFRGVDATSNPYLVLLGVIANGVKGVVEGRELSVRDPERITLKPLEEEVARGFGVVERMPGSLKEALGRLEGDERVRGAVGEEVWGAYLKVKRREEEVMGGMGGGERREASMRVF